MVDFVLSVAGAAVLVVGLLFFWCSAMIGFAAVLCAELKLKLLGAVAILAFCYYVEWAPLILIS